MSEEALKKEAHRLILDGRKELTVSGVADVDSFDENTVVAYTSLGELTVRGRELHVRRLSVESGELQLEGQIDQLTYAEVASRSGGFFSRLFK